MGTPEYSLLVSAVSALVTTLFVLHQINTGSKNEIEAIKLDINRLKTQVEPLWNIVEDSVLKSVIHNPLTEIEVQALEVYHKHRHDPEWADKEILIIGKLGLQRELKELEDSEEETSASTIPYVLAIAAIDRRLGLGSD